MTRQVIKTAVSCIILGALSSCATPQAKLPMPTKEAVKKETALQEELIRTGKTALPKAGDRVSPDPEIRTYAVGNRILIGSADICGERVRNAMPFGIAGDREGKLRVLWSVDRAGDYKSVPKFEDAIEAFDGKALEPGRRAARDLAAGMAEAAINNRSVNVRVNRDGQSIEMAVAPVKSCDYFINYLNKDIENAFANGESINIYRGIIKVMGDDHELAAVIGHELAHNVLDHIASGTRNQLLGALVGGVLDVLAADEDGKVGNSFSSLARDANNTFFDSRFETEADYVGTYIMAAAGFDVEAAPNSERRLTDVGELNANTWGRTHPPSPERAAALDATVDEIKRKIAVGLPLMPELKNGATTIKSRRARKTKDKK
ncbi:MAG: hypothetical protein EXR10_12535 [Alphaproteobacteria bacterium]|nr:hypothetical protein [Alphaproteobacteria bacterium]